MKLSYSTDYESFDHEIDSFEVQEALEHVLDKFTKEELICLLVTDLDIQSELEEYFHDDIKDYYEDEAWDAYRDDLLYSRDPLGYYGMSQRDFL